jgi:hypothetical protein
MAATCRGLSTSSTSTYRENDVHKAPAVAHMFYGRDVIVLRDLILRDDTSKAELHQARSLSFYKRNDQISNLCSHHSRAR